MLDPNSSVYESYHLQVAQATRLPDVVPQVQFTTKIMNDIGRASMAAILDLVDRNPLPRVYGAVTKYIVEEVVKFA